MIGRSKQRALVIDMCAVLLERPNISARTVYIYKKHNKIKCKVSRNTYIIGKWKNKHKHVYSRRKDNCQKT